MTNRTAILISIGLFVAGVISGVVAGLLAGSWMIFFIYLLATLIASVAFIVVHLLNLGGWKWVLPTLIILAGFVGLVRYGGPVAYERATAFAAGLPERPDGPLVAPIMPEVDSDEITVTVFTSDAGVLFFSVGPLSSELNATQACTVGWATDAIQALSAVAGSSINDWALDGEASYLVPPASKGTWSCMFQDLRLERGGGAADDFGPAVPAITAEDEPSTLYSSAIPAEFPENWNDWLNGQEYSLSQSPACNGTAMAELNWFIQNPGGAGNAVSGGGDTESFDIGLGTYETPLGERTEIAFVWGTDVVINGESYGNAVVLYGPYYWRNVTITSGAYRVGIDHTGNFPEYWASVLQCLYEADFTPVHLTPADVDN